MITTTNTTTNTTNRYKQFTYQPNYQRQFLALLLLVAFSFASVACSKHALESAAQINGKFADSLTALQKIARTAHETQKAGAPPGTMVLSDANYSIWVDVAIKLNTGGKDLDAFLRAQASKLATDPTVKVKAAAAIANLAATVQSAIDQDLIKIDNADLRSQMSTTLSGLQSVLNSAAVLLAAQGK